MSAVKTFLKNRNFAIIAIIIILFLPATIYKKGQTEEKDIITTIGLDRVDGEIIVSVLAVVPDNAKTGETLTLLQGKGENLSYAFNQISLITGRLLGLAHGDSVVIGSGFLGVDIAPYIDYFIRTNNLTANALLVYCPSTAEELLKSLSKDKILMGLSVKDLVDFGEENMFSCKMTIDKFYNAYFAEHGAAFMSLLEVVENPFDQASEGGNGAVSGGSESGVGLTSEGEESSGEEYAGEMDKKIKHDNKAVIVKDGKIMREVSEEEIKGYSRLCSNAKTGRVTVYDVVDENFNHADLTFEMIEKITLLKPSFDGDTPVITLSLRLILKLEEVFIEKYSQPIQDGNKSFVTDVVRTMLEEQIKEEANFAFSKLQESQADTFNFASKLNRFYNKKWKKYLDSLEDKENFLDGIELRFTFSIRGKT